MSCNRGMRGLARVASSGRTENCYCSPPRFLVKIGLKSALPKDLFGGCLVVFVAPALMDAINGAWATTDTRGL